jgi:hypothetical protein
MADMAKKRDSQGRNAELRTSARYRLSSPPRIEILSPGSGVPIAASIVDLSRGGCYVRTESELPEETEVTVILRKGEDEVRAQARIVRAVPKEGLALAFTAMEGDNFRILESWLSTFVAATWAATNRRRTQRVAMQIAVRVSGYGSDGKRFTEDTHTLVISAFGGLVILRNPVKTGQRLVLSNLKTKKTVECMVAHVETKGTESQVGLAFSILNQPFWPVDFPPVDWSSRHPDAKRFGS